MVDSQPTYVLPFRIAEYDLAHWSFVSQSRHVFISRLVRPLESATDKLCVTFMFTARHNFDMFTEEVSRCIANNDNEDAEVL